MSLKLASGSYDSTIRFWDPSTGTSIPNQTIKVSSIPNRIQISEDKVKMAVGMNNCIKIYDLNRPDAILRSFENCFKGNVTAVGFKKQDKWVYSACQDGYLRIFDLRKKEEAKNLKQNKPINCAIIHPNQSEIFSGDEAGIFRTWDIGSEKQIISILSENEVGIRSISINKSGDNIVFVDNRGWVQPFGEHLIKCKPIQAHEDYILKTQLSPNNKYLATCSADKRIKLYKTSIDNSKLELTEYKVLKGHFRWVWDCQFSCDSVYLISCSTDGTIKLWDVQKGQLVQTLKGHDKGVICLALNDIAESQP